MKLKKIIQVLGFVFALVNISLSTLGTAYYVDSKKGNDNNNGTSTTTAWKTLGKVNAIVFAGGDQIFLKRGYTFNGYLILKGSGTKGNPIQLAAFGTGKRPVIDATGHEYAVKIMDESHWQIMNIETKGGEKAGIFIGCTGDDKVLSHFRITNCYVHDVGDDKIMDWELSTLTGGIIIANALIENGIRKAFNSTINDAIVDGCTVRYIKRWNCISISSGKINNIKGNANIIRNCTVEYSVADGIRMNGVKNSFIEYSTMYKNGAWPRSPNPDWGGLGAWFFDSDSCTIQFCEASYIDNWHNDGGAFDIDYNQTKSTVQYCYGHDCHGYGVSVFGADSSLPTVNSIVRYNILSNNARDSAYAYQGDIYIFTWNGGLLNGVKVYNNTSYWNPASDAAALKFDADFTGNYPNIFKNNIIYSDHPWLVSLKSDSLQCDNNIYWAANGKMPQWSMGHKKYHSLSDWQKATGQDQHSQYVDPMLNNPTYHGNKNPCNQLQLKPGSRAVDAAVNVGEMGTRDFCGQRIPGKNGKFDIGACEFIKSSKKKNERATVIRIGTTAPDFELVAITGEKIKLSNYQGSLVLLSFINVEHSLQAGKQQAIRSQLTFIKSMQRQYAGKGLKIILVDESCRANCNLRYANTMINASNDNDLNDIPLLRDDRLRNISEKYGVNILPTTFLISKNGTICQQWKNLVLPSQLALAIKEESDKKQSENEWATPAQTIFPGFDAARQLSDNIWMVDGGKTWKQDGQYPVRLLVLEKQDIYLHLKLIHKETTQYSMIASGRMESLPKDESEILLSNMPGIKPKVYSIVFPLSIGQPGDYTIQAIVSKLGKNEIKQTGAVKITVE